MKKHVFLRLLIAFTLGCFLSACEKEDTTSDQIKTSLVGTWKLTSVQINEVEQDLTAYPDYIQFRSNQIFITYDSSTDVITRGGWSYKGDMLNISFDLPAAYYILSVNNLNLNLKRYDFNADGKLDTGIMKHTRVDDSMVPEQ